MQLEGVLSTSQVAKNFMGTGFVGVGAPAPVIVLPSLSDIAVTRVHYHGMFDATRLQNSRMIVHVEQYTGPKHTSIKSK